MFYLGVRTSPVYRLVVLVKDLTHGVTVPQGESVLLRLRVEEGIHVTSLQRVLMIRRTSVVSPMPTLPLAGM